MRYEHIVRFDEWCKKCKYFTKTESEDPCWECLDEPINDSTNQPVKFEEPKARKNTQSYIERRQYTKGTKVRTKGGK